MQNMVILGAAVSEISSGQNLGDKAERKKEGKKLEKKICLTANQPGCLEIVVNRKA